MIVAFCRLAHVAFSGFVCVFLGKVCRLQVYPQPILRVFLVSIVITQAGLIQSKGTLESEQYASLSVISVCKLRVPDID